MQNDLDPKGLRECPFCGGAAKLHGPHADLGAWVSCATCGLEGPTETGQTEEEATEHWNRRHLSAVPDGEGELVEALRKARNTLDSIGGYSSVVARCDAALAASRLSQAGVRDERVKALEEALRRIAEGNLGDDPWQANYDKIRQVAAEALSTKTTGGE